MSTVQEIIAARHCDIRCMAFSIISNIGVLGYDTTDMPSEQDVIVTAQNSEKYLHAFITRFLIKVNLDLSGEHISV
jgi:purine nucleoside phosphorylase